MWLDLKGTREIYALTVNGHIYVKLLKNDYFLPCRSGHHGFTPILETLAEKYCKMKMVTKRDMEIFVDERRMGVEKPLSSHSVHVPASTPSVPTTPRVRTRATARSRSLSTSKYFTTSQAGAGVSGVARSGSPHRPIGGKATPPQSHSIPLHLSHIHTSTNHSSSMSFNLHSIEKYMRSHESITNLLRVDDASLPYGLGSKFRVTTNLRAVYEVEKVAKIFHQYNDSNVIVKYIHLHRNFYRTVNSHSSLDGGFRKHALMLEKYTHFIQSEYARTEVYKPSIWRTVRYEWLHLLNVTEFTLFIDALIEFLEWEDCRAVNITMLQRMIKQPRNTTVNKRDFEFATSLDTEIDTIPLLIDIATPFRDETGVTTASAHSRSDKNTKSDININANTAISTTRHSTTSTLVKSVKKSFSFFSSIYNHFQEYFFFYIFVLTIILFCIFGQ